MPKASQIQDRFLKQKAGEPPYYIDDVSVLFVDIVDFSSLRVARGMQSLVRDLQDTFHEILDREYYWDETARNKPNRIIPIPTGDGYAIAFHKQVDRREILDHVDELYTGLVLQKKMKLRFGISRGPHYVFIDLHKRQNIIGEGIIRAQRAMMLANHGQVLCTSEFAEGIESEIEGRLDPIQGMWQVKAERPFRLFNYRNGKIGKNQEPEKRFRVKK